MRIAAIPALALALTAAAATANSPIIASPTTTGPGYKSLYENNNLLGKGVPLAKRDSVEYVAARYRAVCASEDKFEKMRCARATRMIRKAYAEELERRAAANPPPS